ncbi:ABC transporter substrate-binding protein [Rhodococcus opacus]|nr:ABC transporter substrate-binding protein [Rhodococcus opacus]
MRTRSARGRTDAGRVRSVHRGPHRGRQVGRTIGGNRVQQAPATECAPRCPGFAKPARPSGGALANEDRITLISGAGSALDNSGGYSFRFTDLSTPTMSVGSRLAGEGHTRIGLVVAGDNPSFTTLAEATEKGLPAGFASRQEVSSQDTDFSAVLANLRRDQLDAVVLSVLPAQAGNLILQMKHAGEFADVKLVGTVAISGETYTVAQDSARGFEFPQVWAPGGTNPPPSNEGTRRSTVRFPPPTVPWVIRSAGPQRQP